MSDLNYDDIDLVSLIRFVLKRWLFLVLIIGLSLAGCVAYNTYTPKSYSAFATFIIPSDGGPGGGRLGAYSGLLGMSNSGDIGSYLSDIIMSHRMQLRVVNRLHDSLPNMSPKEAIRFLKLKQTLSVDRNKKTGVFTLSYSGTNPQLCYTVIHTYLSELGLINQELELTPQKTIITVIDFPEIPTVQSKPRPLFNLAVTFLGSFFVGILLLFLFDFIARLWSAMRQQKLD